MREGGRARDICPCPIPASCPGAGSSARAGVSRKSSRAATCASSPPEVLGRKRHAPKNLGPKGEGDVKLGAGEGSGY